MPKRARPGGTVSAGGTRPPRRPAAAKRSNLGRAISILASVNGFNHKTLAAKAGLNDKTLSEWKGGVIPQPGSLRKISAALRCAPEDIQELAEFLDRYQRRQGAAGPSGSLRLKTYEELLLELGQLEIRRLELITAIQERISAGNLH
jgi:hypothetical protein